MDHSEGRLANDRIGGDGPAELDLSEYALDAIAPFTGASDDVHTARVDVLVFQGIL